MKYPVSPKNIKSPILGAIASALLASCMAGTSDEIIAIKPGLYEVKGSVALGVEPVQAPITEQCLGVEESKTSLREILEELEPNKNCKTNNLSKNFDQITSNFSCEIRDIGDLRGRIKFEYVESGYNISINGTLKVHNIRRPANTYIFAKRIGDCNVAEQ